MLAAQEVLATAFSAAAVIVILHWHSAHKYSKYCGIFMAGMSCPLRQAIHSRALCAQSESS